LLARCGLRKPNFLKPLQCYGLGEDNCEENTIQITEKRVYLQKIQA
jgi:hypothetical protein